MPITYLELKIAFNFSLVRLWKSISYATLCSFLAEPPAFKGIIFFIFQHVFEHYSVVKLLCGEFLFDYIFKSILRHTFLFQEKLVTILVHYMCSLQYIYVKANSASYFNGDPGPFPRNLKAFLGTSLFPQQELVFSRNPGLVLSTPEPFQPFQRKYIF